VAPGRSVRATCIATSDQITARYEMASIMKHHPSPTAAMMMPPIEGPMILLPFTIVELSAMAFGRSAGSSTICTTNDWRAGVSNELMIPWTTWSTSTQPTVIVPVNDSAASAADCSAERTCVHTSMRCRSHRSMSTPANGASSSVGIWPQKPTTPSRKAEFVSR
jgi:hypothetical protein